MTAHMSENFEISYQEILNSQIPVYGINYPKVYIPYGHTILYMGHPIVFKDNGIIIVFVKCKFCGQTDGHIENNRCGHCGGWIS